MNKEELKTIINNFKEYDWSYDTSSKTAIYNDDFDLQIKVLNIRDRDDDESLKGEQWDELFHKYPDSKSADINFLYRGGKVEGFPVLLFRGLVIPMPIAANIVDEFYENELSIARMLSEDKKKFDALLNGYKKRKKNY